MMNQFILWTEREDSRLTEAWDRVILVMGHLRGVWNNPFAQILADCFWVRMTQTANLPQLILSYLVTFNGLTWYKSLPRIAPLGQERYTFASQTNVRAFVQPLVTHFANLFATDYDIMDRLWHHYLHHIETRQVISGFVFWTRHVTQILPVPRGGRRTPWLPLVELALILFQTPLSESCVERVFSILREIFGKRRHAMKEDLVEARLILMFHDRHGPQFVEQYAKGGSNIDAPVYETEEEWELASQEQVQ
jgi:hypothetical protein